MNKNTTLKFFATFGAISLVIGCTPTPEYQPPTRVDLPPTPEYRTQTKAIRPQGPEGQECVADCEKKARISRTDCKKENDLCYQRAPKKAKQIYPEYRENYTAELELYLVEDKLYNRRKKQLYNEYKTREEDYELYNMYCAAGDASACRIKNKIKDILFNLEKKNIELKKNKPNPPKKPTIKLLTKLIRKKYCKKDCDPKDQFKKCFIQCGGKIETTRICIKNCEKE